MFVLSTIFVTSGMRYRLPTDFVIIALAASALAQTALAKRWTDPPFEIRGPL